MEKRRHLATFYRPQRFCELRGQEHVKRVLSQAVEKGNIGKAYLFSGTRGVGKTTVARIFAKAINCKNRKDFEPCNQCDLCKEITQGYSLDVLEIDGASHTGVDNVRKLIEDISLVPLKCKYRVIIIDEVHMFSKAAFNALLKTIEEPPPHVVFILATTEVNKIPPTIISRCQHLVFKQLSKKELVDHLKDILTKENIQFEERALSLIAEKGGGSVRDSLSVLSQLINISEGNITERLVRDILGIVSTEVMLNLMNNITQGDVPGVINIVKDILDQGIDIQYFLQQFTKIWRNLFLLKSSKDIVISEEDSIFEIDVLKGLSQHFSLTHIHAAWQILMDGLTKIEKTHDPALFLELLFINLANIKELIPISEYDFSKDHTYKKRYVSPKSLNEAVDKSVIEEMRRDKLTSQFKEKKKNFTWDGFVEFLKTKKIDKKIPYIGVCKGEMLEDKLVITCPSYWLDRLNSSITTKEIFEKSVKEYFGDISYEFNIEKKKDYKTLKEKILNDPRIDLLIKEFNAKILDITSKREKNKR